MTWECNHMERVKGFDIPCGHNNKNTAEVCEECGSPRVHFCSEHHKSWTNGGECTVCAEMRELRHHAETAESSLAAMRQRAEELQKGITETQWSLQRQAIYRERAEADRDAA